MVKIFNVMFSKALGGIEQSFLDYNQAMLMQGFDVTAIIHPHAKVKGYLHAKYHTISNFSKFDIFAAYKLKKLVERENPNCIVAHSGRATALLKKTINGIPIIAVSHNANFQSMIGLDAIIAVNSRMREAIIKAGQPEETVYCLPNMIHIPQDFAFQDRPMDNPPRIGMMARFEEKKGIEIFLKALAQLKSEGRTFKGLIAGDGESKDKILALIDELKLKSDVQLLGWITDKNEFYNNIDIFCLPSLIEPFGIVVLEAFIHSLPAIVTDTEGPLDIATHEQNALIVPKNDPLSLAQAIKRVIDDKNLARQIKKGAYARAQYYSMLNVSRMLQRTIEEVCFKRFKLA